MARTKLVVVALILLAGSVVCGAAAPELVQVGKLKVEAKIEGAGSPAVIFESGFTGGLFLWGPVQSQVGNETQTLSYERAGLGRSDLSAEPRSAERIARELHALLAAKAIAPPYILVGHSAGGLYVRIFAHMYPNEIAGLVGCSIGNSKSQLHKARMKLREALKTSGAEDATRPRSPQIIPRRDRSAGKVRKAVLSGTIFSELGNIA